jgi:ribosomal protein S18 acetylase RimI-like enzyme
MTDGILIRPAGAADGAAIWDILRPIFRAGDTYTIDPEIPRDEALAYWTQARAFVAEAEGRVLGTYYLRPNQQGGGRHVCNCGYATHPAARGRGIARAMLDHSLIEAPRHGFRAMQFNFVVSTNEGAIRLWQRAGFEVVGRLPGAFDHPAQGEVDALVMFRRLEGTGPCA